MENTDPIQPKGAVCVVPAHPSMPALLLLQLFLCPQVPIGWHIVSFNFFTWNRTKFPKKKFFLPFLREKYLGRLDWKKDKNFLVLKLYFFYVSDHNGTTQNSNNSIYRCSEDGTLRIAIKSNPTVRPKTTSGYYTSNKQQFLWSFLYYNSKNKTLHHFPKQIPKI